MPRVCRSPSRAYFLFTFDLLDVTALDYLRQYALVEQVLDIVSRYLRITQSNDLLACLQAFYRNESIGRLIVEKIFIAYLRELPVGIDMSLQNGETSFFLRTHNRARLDERFDKVLYGLRIFLNVRLRGHERTGRNSDPAQVQKHFDPKPLKPHGSKFIERRPIDDS